MSRNLFLRCGRCSTKVKLETMKNGDFEIPIFHLDERFFAHARIMSSEFSFPKWLFYIPYIQNKWFFNNFVSKSILCPSDDFS